MAHSSKRGIDLAASLKFHQICFSILLSVILSIEFTLHRMGIGEVCGMDSQTRQRTSIGSGISVKKTHHVFIVFAHAGSEKARLPSLALVSISEKMFLHALQSLLPNHPIIRVGFARISASMTSRFSITTPSKLIAHLRLGQGCELKFNRSS